ncbi:hypothetical protein Tco_0979182 [Tanacetum coccineum]
MNKRKKHFAMLRAEEKRRKPPTKAQKRNQMSTYLKNMGGYKHNQLKSKSFEEIQKMFANEMRRVNTFIPMDSEVVKSKKEIEESSKGTEDELESDKLKKAEGSEEKTKGSRKKMLGRKRAGKEQQQESSKKQRLEEDKESDEVEEVEEDDEDALKKYLVIKKDDDIAIDVIPLATKLPVIVDYKLHKEGLMAHYELIRADGTSKRYTSMIRLLQGIDREDLQTLWKLVKTKHGDIRPEDEHERVLWGDLKVMFEPDIKSDVWRNLQGYKVKIWKLIDSCGVHFSLNDLLESQVIDKFKTGLGYNTATPAVESFVNLTDKSGSDQAYHSVPPPLSGNFIPRKPDLTFMDEIVESENLDVTTVVTPYNVKTVENKGVSNTVEANAVRMNNTSAPIIEDWNFDDESEIDYTVRPSTKKIKSVKTVRETDAPKQNPRGNQRNWNNLMSQRLGSDFKMTNKACYVCCSFEYLHYVCDKKVERIVWNNSRRVNHKNFSNKMNHSHPKRSFVPQAVLTRSRKLSTVGVAVNTDRLVNTANIKAVNTVRPVNTANTKTVNIVRSVNTDASKPIVNHPKTKTNAFKRGYSQSLRPFNRNFVNKNSIININVNTTRVKHTTARDRAVVSENKGKGVNAVKASACWGNPQQKEYKEKGVIDSGCSRHMTGNKCYLTDYEDYDGGFVSFGDGKGSVTPPFLTYSSGS